MSAEPALVALEILAQVVELVTGKLSFLRPHAYSVEVAYFDFLNRVRMEEESLRSRGLWDVPHPWLNVFVPRRAAAAFKDLLMGTVARSEFEGPVLVYPLLTDRFGPLPTLLSLKKKRPCTLSSMLN
jgi:cytokinin dehydrogenase